MYCHGVTAEALVDVNCETLNKRLGPSALYHHGRPSKDTARMDCRAHGFSSKGALSQVRLACSFSAQARSSPCQSPSSRPQSSVSFTDNHSTFSDLVCLSGYKLMKFLPTFAHSGRPLPAEHDLAGEIVDGNGTRFSAGDQVFGFISVGKLRGVSCVPSVSEVLKNSHRSFGKVPSPNMLVCLQTTLSFDLPMYHL